MPQGGVLSALHFSLFLNELSKKILSSFHLYADDLSIYKYFDAANTQHFVREAVNEDLFAVKPWADAFGLIVNLLK